ncbi:MAG: hypothetical protein HXY49_10320 [Ignavibacteriaceae bacterium]|nr:hypothetical protein [Ignavibacteriaceae bacterium]
MKNIFFNQQCFETVLDRLKKERKNFIHIIENKPYQSELHRKAVEVFSFELLRKDLECLSSIKHFQKELKKINELIDDKKLPELINLLDKLSNKIEKHISALKFTDQENQSLIQLKPGIYGISIDLKALFKKIKSWFTKLFS